MVMGAKGIRVAGSSTRSNAVTVMGLGRALEVAINRAGLTASQFRAMSLVRAGITSGKTLAGFLASIEPRLSLLGTHALAAYLISLNFYTRR